MLGIFGLSAGVKRHPVAYGEIGAMNAVFIPCPLIHPAAYNATGMPQRSGILLVRSLRLQAGYGCG